MRVRDGDCDVFYVMLNEYVVGLVGVTSGRAWSEH